MKYRLLYTLALLVTALTSSAEIKLPAVMCDNMVLQQQTDARIWGSASAGATIEVRTPWSKDITKATVGADGQWIVSVPTPQASYTAQTVTISERINPKDKKAASEVTISNVLIGEVWLASGQSNMEMPLKGFAGCCVKDGIHDAMQAHVISPYVRMFNVKKAQSYSPKSDCEGKWNTTQFPATMEFSATAYYFASALSNALGIPVGIVNSSYGGAHVESWTSRELCETYPDIPTDSVSVYNFGSWDFDRPILMYNAMFLPVKNYTYKGIIWYQGCSNIGHADDYPKRLADMVDLWRKQIGLGEIPFYQVEIAPYMFGDGVSIEGALIREAQMKATTVIPNCDIVGTNDLTLPIEIHNIHPSNKRPVGERLSMLALNKVYGMKQIVCHGPKFRKETFRVEDTDKAGVKRAVVGFITNEMGICRNYGLEGFEVAGADKKFYPAKTEFHWQTNEVYLTADEVPVPVAVRYCFKDFQIGNMIGGNELPLHPFRTDDW